MTCCSTSVAAEPLAHAGVRPRLPCQVYWTPVLGFVQVRLEPSATAHVTMYFMTVSANAGSWLNQVTNPVPFMALMLKPLVPRPLVPRPLVPRPLVPRPLVPRPSTLARRGPWPRGRGSCVLSKAGLL